jgi:hypothetical protein
VVGVDNITAYIRNFYRAGGTNPEAVRQQPPDDVEQPAENLALADYAPADTLMESRKAQHGGRISSGKYNELDLSDDEEDPAHQTTYYKDHDNGAMGGTENGRDGGANSLEEAANDLMASRFTPGKVPVTNMDRQSPLKLPLAPSDIAAAASVAGADSVATPEPLEARSHRLPKPKRSSKSKIPQPTPQTTPQTAPSRAKPASSRPKPTPQPAPSPAIIRAKTPQHPPPLPELPSTVRTADLMGPACDIKAPGG